MLTEVTRRTNECVTATVNFDGIDDVVAVHRVLKTNFDNTTCRCATQREVVRTVFLIGLDLHLVSLFMELVPVLIEATHCIRNVNETLFVDRRINHRELNHEKFDRN